MLNLSARGIALIAKYEGFAPRIYICPAGYKTIGYGHVVLPHEVFDEISENAARKLLRADAAVAERAVRRLIQVSLTQNQFDALVSFVFNVGGGALQRSTLRRLVNRKEYALAAQQFLKWTRAGSKILPGLVARRKEEAALFMDDDIRERLDYFIV